MQAIVTKYIPCTDTRGSRIKATCDRGSISVSFAYDLNEEDRHAAAASALVGKFCEQDLKTYGTPKDKNPWNRPTVMGALPNNKGMVHVFLPY